MAGVLFRVRDDVPDDVGIAVNGEVKAPIPIYPGLPDVLGLIVFLGVQ